MKRGVAKDRSGSQGQGDAVAHWDLRMLKSGDHRKLILSPFVNGDLSKFQVKLICSILTANRPALGATLSKIKYIRLF